MSSTLVTSASAQSVPANPSDRSWQVAVRVFTALGLALSAIAVLDLGLAWAPFNFGNAEWEFGTVTRTMDSLALGTTGLALLAVVALVRRLRWALGVLGIVVALLLAALIGCVVLYGLTVPVALKAVPAAAGPVLERAVFRTASFAVIYMVLYAWLGWFTWRGFRAGSRGGSI